MKRLFMVLLGLAAVPLGSCRAQSETVADDSPKVIAHRGFWQSNPEVPRNSLTSLRNAIEMGCFGTEFDVHITTDGVAVVHHDQETADKKVNIQGVTYSELMEKDGKLADGSPIPTLDEYFEVWKKSDRRVKLILEIKNHGTSERDKWATEKILEVVKKHGIAPSQIEYIAFSQNVCKALADLDCGSPVAYLSGDLSPQEAKAELRCTGVDYNMGVFRNNPDWIEQAHGVWMTVNVWTVDSDADLEYFIGSGVDYITTDRPDVLMGMLAKRK